MNPLVQILSQPPPGGVALTCRKYPDGTTCCQDQPGGWWSCGPTITSKLPGQSQVPSFYLRARR